MALKVYNCIVRIGGDIGNTVPKHRITAAEVLVLKRLHGEDSVLDIEEAGKASAVLTKQKLYSDLMVKFKKPEVQKEVIALFGVAENPNIPDALPRFSPKFASVEDMDAADVEAMEAKAKLEAEKKAKEEAEQQAAAKAAEDEREAWRNVFKELDLKFDQRHKTETLKKDLLEFRKNTPERVAEIDAAVAKFVTSTGDEGAEE
jgi:hypothetical protein